MNADEMKKVTEDAAAREGTKLPACARILRALEIPCLIAVPAVLLLAAALDIQASGLLTLLVALLCLLVFFASFEASRPQLEHIMPTVVLSALAAAGRLIFAVVPNVQPLGAITIMAGSIFGKRCGFMVGALSIFVSNMFLGQGPWTPWQMYAFGLMGYLAGILARKGAFERPWVLYLYGAIAPLGYGFILNTWYIVGFIDPITLTTALLAYGAGLAVDFTSAVSTVAFLVLLYAPWRRKLERIKRKYGLLGVSQDATGYVRTSRGATECVGTSQGATGCVGASQSDSESCSSRCPTDLTHQDAPSPQET